MDDAEQATAQSSARIAPPAAALAGWTAARLDAAGAEAFCHGQAVALHGGLATQDPQRPSAAGLPAGLVRVHDTGGALIGVGAVDGGRLRPVRILHADRPDARVLPA